MSVDQRATIARRLNVHFLVWQKESMYTQQHVRACVCMVYLLHLYVRIHWISPF